MYMYLDSEVFYDPEQAQRYYVSHPDVSRFGFFRDGIERGAEFEHVHEEKNIFERIHKELHVQAALSSNSNIMESEKCADMQDDLSCFCLTPIAESFGQLAETICFREGRWTLDNETCTLLAQQCALHDIESGLEQNKGLDQLTDEYQNLDSQELLYQYDLRYDQTMYSRICDTCRRYENIFGKRITEDSIALMTVPFTSRDARTMSISRSRSMKDERDTGGKENN